MAASCGPAAASCRSRRRRCWSGSATTRELRKLDGELRARRRAARRRCARRRTTTSGASRAILETLAFDRDRARAGAKRIVDTVLAVRVELEDAAPRRGARAQARARASAPGATTSSGCAPSMRRRWPRWRRPTRRRRCARSPSGWPRRRRPSGCARSSSREPRSSPPSTPRAARAEREADAALDAWRARAGVDDDGAFAAGGRRGAPPPTRSTARSTRSSARSPRRAAPWPPTPSPPRSKRPSAASSTASWPTRAPSSSASTPSCAPPPSASAPPRRRSTQLDGGARAAELGAGVESRRAELRGLVEQYAVVTLSRALLERQVARFQERHQPRMIEELSSLFRALTEGRYTRVYPRYDDEGTFVAVRADGVEVTPARDVDGHARAAVARGAPGLRAPVLRRLRAAAAHPRRSARQLRRRPRARHARRARRLRHAHAGADADLPRAPGRRWRATSPPSSRCRFHFRAEDLPRATGW